MRTGGRGVGSAFLVLTALAATAAGQSDPELAGPVRDLARTEIVNPALFDPRIDLPLTPTPQAAVELRGAKPSATVRAGLQRGDASYGLTFSVPFSPDASAPFRDRRTLPQASLGIDLTNIVWRPKAKPALTRQLSADGFLTSPTGEPLAPPVHGTTPVALSRSSEQAVARTIRTTDAVDVPWVFVFSGGYKFTKTIYDYTEASSSNVTSASHLSDVADVLFGLQFLARGGDPGYFVAFSYNYSSLFRNADRRIGPPERLFGTVLRLEMRRPLVAAHMGFNPSFSYEMDTHLRTVETTAYWWLDPDGNSRMRSRTRLHTGVRVGYEEGRGGLFASVFITPVLVRKP